MIFILHTGDFGIYNSGTGTVTVSEGTVNGGEYGINNYSKGNIVVQGGTIEGNCGINNVSQYEYSKGNIVVQGGTINGRNYGIYNTGTIIVGIQSDEKPSIKGNIGIYNTKGKFEFYSGKIQGSSSALRGNITKIKEGYKIENTRIDNLDTIYLTEKTDLEYIAQIEDNKYYTLKEAIESIDGDNEKTIKILKDFELDEKITFYKNIILDLNNYSITSNYFSIENTGKLTITDNTETQDGKIELQDYGGRNL